MENGVERGFYEIGAYRHNVRRYKEGIEQLTDVQLMLKERIELESVYSKCLQAFHEKWSAHAAKISTTSVRTVWDDVLGESMELHKLHTNVKERISDEIIKTIALYLKENYHTSAFRSAREIRDIEEQFEKAQRPWKKHYEKAEKARKAFHIAAQKERSSHIQKKNAEGDPSISADNARKYEERWQKCKDEAEKAEVVYKKAIDDLNGVKSDYIARMRDVFETCQQKELKRLKFVFEMLSGLQKVLADLATATKLNQLHRRLEESFEKDDERFTADLNEWSQKFGVDCEFSWPKFEPYTPMLHSIGSKKDKSVEGEVVLMRQTIKNEDECGTSVSSNSAHSSVKRITKNSISAPITNGATNGVRHVEIVAIDETNGGPSTAQPNGSNENMDGRADSVVSDEQFSPASATYGDNFDQYPTTPLYSAKVLYDYKSQDTDEISIYKGEMVEVFSEPDSLNWSIGRKNGKKGLFPAAYVEKL